MADIRDVAKKAGVSPSTVSRVMNNLDRVSPITREKVMKAVQELEYIPNAWARSMRTETMKTVGIMVENMSHPFYMMMIKEAETLATAMGYYCLFCSVPHGDEEEVAKLKGLIARQAEGVIVLQPNHKPGFWQEIDPIARTVPIVAVNHATEGQYVHSLSTDSLRVAYQCARHLAEQGYKQIGHITAPEGTAMEVEMRRGFIQALREKGIPIPYDYTAPSNQTIRGGYLAMKAIMSAKKKPQAVFASDDASAIGAMWCAEELGLTIPDEIAIMGYGNIPQTLLCRPTLSTVILPITEMLQDALNIINLHQTDQKIEKIYDVEIETRHSTDPNVSVRLDFGQF